MKRTIKSPSARQALSLGAHLGGKVSLYRDQQEIYTQGEAASTLFYIQSGMVRLSNRSKDRKPAVTAILRQGDFFGMQCLIGFPLRLSTATSVGDSSVRSVPKQQMRKLLHSKHRVRAPFLTYLLAALKKNQDHVTELLAFNSEQRLACALLALAEFDRGGPLLRDVPSQSHAVLSQMIGTTRSRVNFFMNEFRKRGYIAYNDVELEVHRSLSEVLHPKRPFAT